MTRNLLHWAAAAALFATSFSSALASPLTWTINSTASSYTLKIPDQNLSVSGNNIGTVRFRNQNASAWTTNVAKLQGTVATDYDSVLQKIQFLGGQTDIGAINSGSYRPNPASWNLVVANNSYQNTSTSPGVIGGLLRAPSFGLLLVQVDLANFNIFDMNFDLASDVLPISGTSVNLQAGTGTNFGISSSKLNLDGFSFSGATQPDFLQRPFSNLDNNNSLSATLTSAGTSRHLVIPIQQNFTIDLTGNTFFIANSVGTLVLDAVVPEPSTLLLATLGAASLAICIRRRLSSHRA